MKIKLRFLLFENEYVVLKCDVEDIKDSLNINEFDKKWVLKDLEGLEGKWKEVLRIF